ncbi:hypothetical protein [Nocardia thailandica]|nr:hypothetical protein [Nocardia thailandica]
MTDLDSSVTELAAMPAGEPARRDAPTDPWAIEDFVYSDEAG